MKVFLSKLNNYFNILLSNTLYSLPIFEALIGLNLVIIRIVLNRTIDFHNYMRFEAPFYDTGTLMSLLICLEHIFVTYYLIIILVMVYWCLYVFIIDFSSWNSVNKNNILKSISLYLLNNFINIFVYLYVQIYINILKLILIFKEFKFLIFLYNSHLNSLNQFPFNLNKTFLIQKNLINIFSNFFKQFDFLGRSILIINQSTIKFIIILSLLVESILLLQEKFNYKTYIVKKKMNYFLFYSKPKSFFFSLPENGFSHSKKVNKLSYSNWLISLRSLYNNVFSVNQFKHSGIFEAIWAAFPTIIIVSILIPSLILLYSFEDILNPKMTIKVIGNQWYWTYEFDNWINYNKRPESIKKLDLGKYPAAHEKPLTRLFNELGYKDIRTVGKVEKFERARELLHAYKTNTNKDEPMVRLAKLLGYKSLRDYTNKAESIYSSFAFNSVIVDLDSLELGEKRLLEVDNRLVLSTNLTTRFLVTSVDVLHAFAVPELGFKVDAVPGRLNQILVFVSRPGVYYGQCSELCGTNHGFMPIVIQAVTPSNYLNYIKKINSEI